MNMLQILNNYKSFDDKEEQERRLLIDYFSIFGDKLFFRENKIGHFTANSITLNEKRDKILLVKHKIYNDWILPGGHADGEKDLLKVALKETIEETSIQNIKPVLKEVFDVHIFVTANHMKKGKYIPGHLDFCFSYLFIGKEEDIIKGKADENEGASWKEINEELSFGGDIILRDRILKKLREFRI